MLLKIVRLQDPRTFRVSGELDLSNAKELANAIGSALHEPGDLTLDLADLAFMDSSGLRVLLEAADAIEGGDLVLRSPRTAVRRVLELSGTMRLAHLVVESGEEAAEATDAAG